MAFVRRAAKLALDPEIHLFDSNCGLDYDRISQRLHEEYKPVGWRQISVTRELLASEQGAIIRDWGGQTPIVLAYPNSYSVGMSSLAMHTLYRWLNALPGIVCERAFASLGQITSRSSRQADPDSPLLTLESQRPVGDAACVAFSVSFEMDYFNILDMLRRAHIPQRADQRQVGDPLVILGGPAVSANPLPMAPLADAIVIGEAEEALSGLAQVIRDSWSMGRNDALEALAQLPGVHVPLVNPNGPVERLYVADLDTWPTETTVVSPQAEFGHMHLIEISRGCGRGCRFCLAGYWYRPRRERSLDAILEQARAGLAHADTIGLVASAVSDYGQIDELVAGLQGMGARLSVSSLRVQPLSETLIGALARGGARSITLAPEAGSERLRQAIRKGVTFEGVMQAAEAAQRFGFEMLKLYFMVGLPGESDEDLLELLQMIREIQTIYDRHIVVNVTPFVPKAHTPFQHVGMMAGKTLSDHVLQLRSAVKTLKGNGPIELRSESVEAAQLQGVLAMGDATLGEALLDMKRPSRSQLKRALRQRGVEMASYLEPRDPAGPMPWNLVQDGLPEGLLRSEWSKCERTLLTTQCEATDPARRGE